MMIIFNGEKISYEKFIDDLAKSVARRIEEAPKTELVTTEEAAKILGITPNSMRKIKDRFPHIKGGENKQGKLLFVKDALLKNY